MVKSGAEMITEGMDLCKPLAGTIAETEVEEVLTEVIIVTGVDREKGAYLPGGIIVIGNMATID